MSRFTEILDELRDLHEQKQADYGTDADPFANLRAAEDFGLDPIVGVFIRMRDKMKRIEAYTQKKLLPRMANRLLRRLGLKEVFEDELRNERVEDTLRDMAVYSVIALTMMEEEAHLLETKILAFDRAVASPTAEYERHSGLHHIRCASTSDICLLPGHYCFDIYGGRLPRV